MNYIYIYISNPFFFSVLVSVMATIDIIPNKNKREENLFLDCDAHLKPYIELCWCNKAFINYYFLNFYLNLLEVNINT